MDTKDLLKQVIVGLASGTEEGRASAEQAGRQAVQLKSAEVLTTLNAANQSPPTETE